MRRASGVCQTGGSGAAQGRALLLLAALTIAGCCPAGCANDQAQIASLTEGPVTLRIGYPNVTGQDPSYGIQQAARLISFEGLSLIARDGRPQPRLAEGWTESPDGLTWRITLRANAVFHDGSTVDAAAVKRSLEQSLAGADRDLLPGLQDIDAIEAPSPRELVIRLRNRSTFLLEALTVSVVKTEQGRPPVGTGPYVTDSMSPNRITMRAFPSYHQGAPTIASLVWQPYSTARTAWAALMRDEVDFLYEVGPDALEFVQAENSLQVFSSLRYYVYGLVFNSSRPAFRDPRVRRALNYAVDRTAIVEQAFKGRGTVAHAPAWPLHWAFDGSVPGFPYDPARASALLDASAPSPPAPRDGNRAAPGRLRFTCLLPETFALWERMALMVQRSLADIGVDMQLEGVSFEEFNRRIAVGSYDAVLMETIAGLGASRPYVFWRSGSKRNFSGYRSPAVDEALDGIRYAANDREYREAFHGFQLAVMDDPPAIFLAWGQTARAVSRRFDVQPSPGGNVFATINAWRLVPGVRAAR
jgi:ABC-type transport system substrate-binding protein